MSSPDGSYTEEQNSETQVKAAVNPTSGTPEFDDEFDDEETLPTIGTCKALYPFEGTCHAHEPDDKLFTWQSGKMCRSWKRDYSPAGFFFR